MSAATRLEAALLAAAEELMAVVGLPRNPVECHGERIPVNGSLVDHDAVPDMAYRAACAALQYLMVGYSIMDPEAPQVATLAEELAAITEGRGDG